ncbi:MAG: aldose epimerase [Cyanobacteria bacterium J06643_4]
MYSIGLKKEQYDTYILSDRDSNARVEVVPERGGIITQWQLKDTPLLYLNEERFKDPTKTVRGGIPILFPICGNLPDDTYTLDGQDYTLVQHGFARNLPWQVSDKGVKADPDGGAFITLTLESNDDTRSVYPFDFLLEFTYRLQGNRLILRQRYTNKSEKPMPFSTGFHPYFQVDADPSVKSQLQLSIPAAEYDDNLTKTTQPYDGSLDLTVPEVDAAFRPISAQQASVADPTRQTQITLHYDEAFTTLVFWTVAEKAFYCLEPWSAPRNAINTQTDLLTLLPGETKALNVTFEAAVSARS